MGGGGASRDDSVEVQGVRLIARRVKGLDKTSLRTLSDSLRDQLGSGVVVLANETDDKVTLVVAVTRDLAGRLPAGTIVRQVAPIVGGGGGGRADFAEAGGRDVSKIEIALTESRAVVERLLTAS
jgi:alanyl-tRNA synthetase